MFYNKNNFLVNKIASKDQSRPVLCATKFESEATVATDGYKLMICETPKDISSEDMGDLPSVKDSNYNVVIPSEMVENVARALPKKPILPWLSNAYFTDTSDNSTVEMITTDGINTQKHTSKAIEDEYPKYNAIVPKGSSVASVNVNVKLLKQVVDVLCKMDLDSSNTVKVNLYADLLPVSITTKTVQGQNVQALIMPIKVKTEDN